jgi:hypothetical protein
MARHVGKRMRVGGTDSCNTAHRTQPQSYSSDEGVPLNVIQQIGGWEVAKLFADTPATQR